MILRIMRAKITAGAVRLAPCKICAIELLTCVVALESFLLSLRARPWRDIAGFAKLTGATDAGWRFLWRQVLGQARRKVWTSLYYELPDQLDKYISLEGLSQLEDAIQQGQGAVLLGAHYGPRLTTFLLQRQGIDVRPLIAQQSIERMQYFRSLPRLVSTRRVAFFCNEMRPFASRRSERDLVRHVKKGNVVFIAIDMPFETGALVRLFGQPMKLPYFPFKVAQRYEAPVFHCFFETAPSGGYTLRITPAGDFSTPEEGAADYARHLEKQVRSYPHSWDSIPSFMKSITAE